MGGTISYDKGSIFEEIKETCNFILNILLFNIFQQKNENRDMDAS